MDFDEVKHLIEEFFNGKFEVKKFLGEGSFAKVYLVYHNYLDTLMAMKIVKEPLNASISRRDIFREVTIVCQLRHENIISIYDAAEISDFEDGKSHAYFVMEYVPGGDLGRFLNSFAENEMFMPIGRSLNLIKQILNGLNTLHSANPPIVHRDLKLNNVLLNFNACGDIVIKISDFGFAKEVTTGISDIDIAGTRPYMAPELFNKSVSTKSDIYAVGVMFYQLLTNHYPYDVEKYTNEELIDLKPWNADLKPPSHYNEAVFKGLDDIVIRCLDMNPDNRYADAGEMLDDVLDAIDSYGSIRIEDESNSDYHDDYSDFVFNDSLKRAFDLAKCENKLCDAIEILEREVLADYDVRRCYCETLRIWKSQRPDIKLISKAFTVNIRGKNYKIACSLLKEAIAYNPSLKSKYQPYIELWEIFIDLERHKSLFKSVVLLENLMESSNEINETYRNILPALKTYSVDEIVIESRRLADLNDLTAAANLMEFAVVCNSGIRDKYAYEMSLWKQNMKMNFKYPSEIKQNAIDYAIDLGTTDSVMSYFNNGDPIVIKNHTTGDDFTPSAILVDGDDNVEVGEAAREAILENNRNAISEFKHDMGFSIPLKFENSSRVMFPEELSAEVLKDLRVSAFNQKGVNIEHAVICVPANSNPIKTRAVRQAAELAGFRSCSLILEPVAVSLAYNLKKENGIWMIYDLGGGTFNATLIGDNAGEIEKIATVGLDNLGGNAFDWKIVDEVFRPRIAHDLDLHDFRRDNPVYFKEFAKLKNAAEIAKKDLTKSITTDICLDDLFDDYSFGCTLTRDRLKEIMEPLINHTLKLSRNLLNENSLSDDDIDKIILVGGSSLSPIVRECIADEFEIEIESGIDPLTVVARGAAIYAGSLEKPHIDTGKESISVALSYQKGQYQGKVFSTDSKFPFLGHDIEFKNSRNSLRVPLDIDGEFKVELPDEKFHILIYNKGLPVTADDKSPDWLENGKIHIPYLDESFKINCDGISCRDLIKRHEKLTWDIEFLRDYSYDVDDEIMGYVERLIEISNKNPIAINQAVIYINHLEHLVDECRRDFEFSALWENVSKKIGIVKDKNLFEIEDADEILKSGDFSRLDEFHSSLIEKYVALNRNDVIGECFFNLKVEGIYTDNEQLAVELIEMAQNELNNRNYNGLFGIVKQLYELDERN